MILDANHSQYLYLDREPSLDLLIALRDNIDDEALVAIIDELASREYQL